MKKIEFSPPHISTKDLFGVIKVLKSGWITTGNKTKKFEKSIANYIDVEMAVCLNSATAAMENTLRLLNIGPGDEVITSVYTYTASAAVINHVGAKIVLVDVDKTTFEMDYKQLENSITENTKAIIAVDIAGIICNYDKIYEIVEKKKFLFKIKSCDLHYDRIIVIADAAHSFGAVKNQKKSGNFADFTCFSFHAVKNLTTGEGGAVVWKNTFGLTNEEIYKKFMVLSLHGQSKDAFEKNKIGSWEYDIETLGYKNNMTDVLSALGLSQLKRYDKILQKRHKLIKLYNKYLNTKIIDTINHTCDNYISSGHLMICNIKGFDLEKRNNLILNLAKKGIVTNVHYKPLPLFKAYKELGFKIDYFPRAYNRYISEITLPLHTKLNKKQIKYISKNINYYVNISEN